MSIFNIQTKIEYNLSTATWNTGNSRDNIIIKPQFGVADYISCVFDISITGNVVSLRSCRLPTEAWHGAQPNPDIMIDNIITESYK